MALLPGLTLISARRNPFMNKPSAALLLSLACLPMTGCDMLGIDTPAKQRALVEADGKAVGSACRHAGRAIEDCYTLNPTASRAAVFTGWKEMNDYMSKNKIEVVKPEAVGPTSTHSAKKAAGEVVSSSAVFMPPAGFQEAAGSAPLANAPIATFKPVIPAKAKPAEKVAEKPAEKLAEKPAEKEAH